MTALHTPWQKVQHYFWLVCGVCCLFAALIFWAITDSDAVIEVEKKPETKVQLQIQPEKVATMTHLGALFDEVKPLDLNTRTIVNATHEPEFRGTKFVNEAKKQHAIELFRVSNEAILKSFLKKQPDRKYFIYLRISGENQPEQYVLLYGQYKTAAEANQALSTLNLNLPASVKPEVVPIQQYVSLVNNLGSEELASNQKLYEIRLKNVPLPKVDESVRLRQQTQAEVKPRSSDATTSTTIVRRDAAGNVLDVQKSESAVEGVPQPQNNNNRPNQGGNSRPQNNEISDPFN
ncbi:hypothetical protein F906_00284 [Acinetobacter pseudolwoffii]|uniref:SPOR domain-containing protein n=1 Tax=Acinetobacter pseudolwoffii TaxID=2053287 RepID=N9M5H6_9GAMM|nr:hypothetical protein [Acinetobacter pseudolwoffii]ENW88375.1 hypothetical protein F906_00284 [Acinetobacter pseudolwoffii]